jgi:hypothetical protein
MKNDPPKGKCSKKMKKCRRWRRRSANVTNQFKAKKGWLETHLWHAKRCKMINYWGFKVASHLNEKCFKSTYRSSVHGVLLHDSSYWQPFWIDCNIEKLTNFYGNDDIIDVILEDGNVQICPIKFFIRTFQRPLILLHPAALETGILDHESFKSFLNSYDATLTSASDLMCTFKLHGPKAESVLVQLFNFQNFQNFPLRILLSDPRISKRSGQVICENFDEIFADQSSIKSDNDINIEKSQLFITSAESGSDSYDKLAIAVTRKGSEYFISCPKKWARIIWYNLIKIKPIKVAGIEQIDFIAFENEIPNFPKDFVSSSAYQVWAEAEKCRLEAIYNRKPPAKRPSYAKYGIDNPFKPDFTQFGELIKIFIEINGKGIITNFAEIYTPEKVLIGYATTTTKSSLKKGFSCAVASVSKAYTENLTTVLVRNYCSPDVLRIGKIKLLPSIIKK